MGSLSRFVGEKRDFFPSHWGAREAGHSVPNPGARLMFSSLHPFGMPGAAAGGEPYRGVAVMPSVA